MRIGRAKSVRKTLAFYKLHGNNIEVPYKILCDGNFLVASFRYNVPILERMERLFQGEKCILYTTFSIMKELKVLQEAAEEKNDETRVYFESALDFIKAHIKIIKKIPKIDLNAGEEENSTYLSSNKSQASKDLIKLLCHKANHEGYFLATQDEKLRSLLRSSSKLMKLLSSAVVIHIPMLFFNKVILILESPSTSSQQLLTQEETIKTKKLLCEEENILSKLITKQKNIEQEQKRQEQRQQLVESGAMYHGDRSKKRAKGPNPLSCKKKKRKLTHDANEYEQGREDTKQSSKKPRRRARKKNLETSV